MTENSSIENIVPTGLIRRFMAIIYDLLLLLAILFIASLLAFVANRGVAIDSSHPYHTLYMAYLLMISFLYFAWFWVHGGQILGMKTWKIKLLSSTLGTISWKQALIRFCSAAVSWCCLGCGVIWSVFDKQHRTWHDIASNSRLIDLRHVSTNSSDH